MPTLRFPLRAFFLALPLHETASESARAIQERLRAYGEILRFQNPLSAHLTLSYWRKVEKMEYLEIAAWAEKFAGRQKPFHLRVNGAQTFGARGKDNVLFLAVDPSPELALITTSCPWTDELPFIPHVTIARIRHVDKFSVYREEIMKQLQGAAFDVFVDRLRAYGQMHGVQQTPLEDFPFSAIA